MGPDVNDFTDEQLEAMTAEELEALGAGGAKDEAGELEGAAEVTEEALDELLEEEGTDHVPRARMNEVIAERNDFREMLKLVLANKQQEEPAPAVVAEQPPAAPEVDAAGLLALRKQLAKAQMSGDEEEVDALIDKVANAEQALFDYRTKQANYETERRITAKTESERITDIVADAESKFRFLQPGAKEFDEAAALAVNAKARQLAAGGKTPSAALREAVNTLGPRFAKLLGFDKAPGKPAAAATDPRIAEALARAGRVKHGSAGNGIGNRERGLDLDITKLADKDLPEVGTPEYNRLVGRDKI